MEAEVREKKSVNLTALIGTVPPVLEIPDPEFFNFKAIIIILLPPDLKNILLTVCNYFGMSMVKAVEPTRKKEVIKVRQVSMYFAKHFTKESLASIGAEYGGKDHATVLHAIKTVNNLCDTEKKYCREINLLTAIIKRKFKITPNG